MRHTERLLLQAENPPFGCLYRVAIGFLLVPAYQWLFGRISAFWPLLIFFACALLLLRIVPAFVRHLFPFSKETQELWSKRRQLAKYYDSYQWRKLFWIGLGLAGYTLFLGDFGSPNGVLALFCLPVGALGLWFWRRVEMNQKKARL